MQSCDICRKRKVKCDRRTPCARCRRLRQPCTYTDILRKKGPKFVHSYPSIYPAAATYTITATSSEMLVSASASNEALPLVSGDLDLDLEMGMGMGMGIDIEEQLGGTEHTTGVVSRTGTGTTSELGDELDLELDFGNGFPAQQQLQQDLNMGIGLDLESNFRASATRNMENAVSLFAVKLYPLFPVVDVRELRLGFQLGHGWNDEHGSSRYALLCSICAAVHAHMAFDSSSSKQELKHDYGHEHVCERYLRDALKTRSQFDLIQHQSFQQEPQSTEYEERDKILNLFFLFLTYWFLRRESHAWWYLRECISLLLSRRMHHEDEYRKLEPRGVERTRVIFWAVFIVERTFCLLHDKPITLRPWIDLPNQPNVLDENGVIPAFVHLVTLFQGMIVDLSGRWTAAGFVTPVTLVLATPAAHGYDDADTGTPSQRVELAVTREWLRAKIWKIGTPGRRSSLEFVASKDNAHWRFDEPLSIGKDILGELQALSSVLQDNWSATLDQKLCGICECLYDIRPVMQTMGQSGESDLDQILQGLLEVVAKVGGRSAHLLSHPCQSS